MRSIGIALLLLPVVFGAYNVEVLLRRFDNGQGFLANGSHCAPYWNLGDQCNIRLKVAVCLGSPKDTSNPCPSEERQPIDLGSITKDANAIDFAGAGTSYGAWKNPEQFPDPTTDAVYSGFSIYVEVAEATTSELIDSYAVQLDDGTSPNNFKYYSHPRGLIEPTLLAVAWRVSGDRPTPPPPPTTTTPEPSTESTTTGPSTTTGTTEASTTTKPITAVDCDEVDDKQDGVKTILVNGTLVEVYCQYGTAGKAYTTIQSRGEADATPFNKTFDEFKDQFGTAGKGNNYWFGLDNMHTLTSGGIYNYSLMIEVCCGNVSTKQYYYNAVVGGGSDYTLTATAAQPGGLAFADINSYGADLGKPFRTYESWRSATDDADYCAIINNNEDPKVTKASGGWWFGNCGSNLNGVYFGSEQLDEKCHLPVPKTGESYPQGPGIELLVGTPSKDQFPIFSGVSYTRSRMALYRGTRDMPLPNTNFCEGV